jgi:hypothetical protein
MPSSTRFRLNRSGVLLALISAAFAGQAQAAAGRVEFAVGGATLAGPNGQQRPATRGSEVNSGDVVRTTDGRVQVRMADGAYISLQPNTEFGIKDYRFEGKTDGTEGAFYSLLKGAMRTVTGLIGRVNRNRYQVATPTATVGIRGTGGLIQILNDGSTLVQGTSGIWFLANPSGSINVPAGVSGISPSDPKQPPKETETPPTAGPAPLPPEDPYVQGDQTEADGTAVITVATAPTGPILQSGSGYMGAFAFGANSGTTPQLARPTGSATFNGIGELTSFVAANGDTWSLVDGSHADFGTDGVLAWGRWIGTATVSVSGSPVNESYAVDQGFHYVVGMPTPRLPQSGSATYRVLGATQPTFLTGGTPGTFSFAANGGLIVNFFAGGATLNLQGAVVDMPSYGTYTMNGTGTICGATSSFSFNPAVAGSTCAACGCSAAVNGFFAGASAERAGMAYHITDFAGSKNVVGAVALTK